MSPVRAVIALIVVISAAFFTVVAVRRFVEQRHMLAEIDRMRDELYRARVAADRCRSSLVTSESALQALGLAIDSIRSRVDSFEALGGGRVPGEHYDEYLDVFDSYNDSVASWEARSQRLRAAEASCRATILRHNALSDSIQGVLSAAGIDGA